MPGLAVEHERPITAQADPVGIAGWRNHGEPVESATQHDDQQAGIAALGPRQFRRVGPGEQRT